MKVAARGPCVLKARLPATCCDLQAVCYNDKQGYFLSYDDKCLKAWAPTHTGSCRVLHDVVGDMHICGAECRAFVRSSPKPTPCPLQPAAPSTFPCCRPFQTTRPPLSQPWPSQRSL